MTEDIRIELRLIAEGNPVLAKIGTGRAILYQSIPLLIWIKHQYQKLMFRVEYAYDYGMPH